MSYCRWSSDDWTCDLYLYSDTSGGWTLHVAGNRAVDVPKTGPMPLPAKGVSADEFQRDPEFQAWWERYRAQMEYLKDCPRKDIDHELAGETFRMATLEEVEHTLLMLRAEGFVFQDYVLEAIREELADEALVDDVAAGIHINRLVEEKIELGFGVQKDAKPNWTGMLADLPKWQAEVDGCRRDARAALAVMRERGHRRQPRE